MIIINLEKRVKGSEFKTLQTLIYVETQLINNNLIQ